MELSTIGRPTFHTRVERWECDYNDHWNVRFYGRSFQMAAEVVAAGEGRPSAGADAIRSRHLRFHRELRVSAPVEIRSATLTDAGDLTGATVHLLVSAGTLAATALDFPGGAEHLPRVAPEDVALATPRGILSTERSSDPGNARIVDVELGPIRGEDLDHTGKLRFETLIRHGSTIQHTQLNALGLTPEFAETHRINRMGVEFRVTRGATPEIGALLRGRTWITKIEGKAIWAFNQILSAEGDTVATIEMCIVTVDLDSRKAAPAPDFLRKALGR